MGNLCKKEIDDFHSDIDLAKRRQYHSEEPRAKA
jgi:hypothetical protein